MKPVIPTIGDLVATGVTGLDYILHGGFQPNQVHLVEGLPGVGKTLLGLHFLAAGRALGETCIFICFGETIADLTGIAVSHGLSIDGINILESLDPEPGVPGALDQSILHPADLELGETIDALMKQIDFFKPQRVVISSFSEIHLLAEEALPYRRQIRVLLKFFESLSCTVLLLEDLATGGDIHLQSLAQSVIRLEQLMLAYGGERRRLRVNKMNGGSFCAGYHDFVTRRDGIQVFPRLVSADHPTIPIKDAPVSTGIANLDTLLCGGIELGTTTLIRGPSGAGKSALALQPLNAALVRGEKALFISFDETFTNFVRRSHALGMTTGKYLDTGALCFMHIDPAEVSPGEFADTIRRAVLGGVSAIVIDSLSGYQHAMPAENNLLLHLHELLTFLNQQGILTIVVLANGVIEGIFGSPAYMTYLADTVVVIRFLEMPDGLMRAVSVAKKRTGNHEYGARALTFDNDGILVGKTLYTPAMLRPYRAIDPLFNFRAGVQP